MRYLTHLIFNNSSTFFSKKKCRIILLHNPCPNTLEEILGLLRKIGPFVRYSAVVEAVQAARTVPQGFVLTFDDGYKENMALLEVLDKYDCKGMFFLSTGIIDSDNPLWFMNLDAEHVHIKSQLKNLDYSSFLAVINRTGLTAPSRIRGRFGLRSEDVRTLLERGHEVGVHTENHPFLTSLSDEEIRCEVLESLGRLRSITGNDALPLHFAYPDGDYNERVVSALKHCGASSACTVDAAPTTAMTSPLKIPRYCLGDADFSGVALFKLTRFYKAIKEIS
ncbi:MAG: polysaccharide deacetylase family protein [Alphaproteobacteria bacterium]|nr:polysaccharide deacetylase family protein [Alphaproteobacteria bacterium]